MNTTSTGTKVPAHTAIRKSAKFVSYYSTTDKPNEFLRVEHTSENAARKGSWQSSAMRAVWIYRGYCTI